MNNSVLPKTYIYFIILLFIIQSYFPLSYYLLPTTDIEQHQQQSIDKSLGSIESLFKKDDERFSWRMFSPTAIDTKCSLDLFYKNNKTNKFTNIKYQDQYFKQWIDLVEMCRTPVIKEIVKDQCIKNQLSQIILIHLGGNFDRFIKTLFGLGDSLINDSTFTMSIVFGIVTSIRCAFQVNSIFEPYLIAVIKAFMVFSSQSDNYQHHYLLVLVLLIIAPIASINVDSLNSKYKVYPFKFLTIQLSIVYFWTFIAKLHSSWFSGQVLPRMLGPEFKRFAQTLFGSTLFIDPMVFISISTVLVELFLVFSLHIEKLRIPTFIFGVSMHIMMGCSGLRIGTFSYFMVIFYFLYIPVVGKRLVCWVINLFRNVSQLLCIDMDRPTFLIAYIGGFGVLSMVLIQMSLPKQFLEFFQIGFSFIIIFILLQALLLIKNQKQLEKEIHVFVLCCLLVCLASRSTPHFRKAFTERATMTGVNNIDLTIANYEIATEILDQEWKYFRLISSPSSEFEFIGDLGIFLESKNNFTKAHTLYNTYYPLYPDQLKLHVGLLRIYQENNDKKSICSMLNEKTCPLAVTISNKPVFSIDDNRNHRFANHVLEICNQLSHSFNC
ncbi:hypothetical protein CYY_004483 [Polysphondylium violaceum]|uniref:HTTM domain-containing protein n=1 Tax=Polysphondylium violaceum TaxID=133409 RepID=A0A8J4PV26_9MYCE|nr:hypothetical protein CYY_004483 [Polysphondylium violaceum]